MIGMAQNLVEVNEITHPRRSSQDHDRSKQDAKRSKQNRGSGSRSFSQLDRDDEEKPKLNTSLSKILVAIKNGPKKKKVWFPNFSEGQTLGRDYDK